MKKILLLSISGICVGFGLGFVACDGGGDDGGGGSGGDGGPGGPTYSCQDIPATCDPLCAADEWCDGTTCKAQVDCSPACKATETCDKTTGTCKSKCDPECETNGSEYCDDGKCKGFADCGQCYAGEVCTGANECKPTCVPECAGEKETCDGGVCKDMDCVEDTACGVTEYCSDPAADTCTACDPACSTTEACMPGGTNGTCVEHCGGCAAGEYCNQTTGNCVECDPECATDGSETCTAAGCAKNCDPVCGDTKVCDSATGECFLCGCDATDDKTCLED